MHKKILCSLKIRQAQLAFIVAGGTVEDHLTRSLNTGSIQTTEIVLK
jgi:hypothetical protein